MGGIVGLFNLDGRAVERSHLTRLSRASAHRAVDGERFWIGPSAGIGHQSSHVTPESIGEVQPLSVSGLVISFDGRLDNRQELIAWCARERDGHAPALSDAALALAAYVRFDDQFAGHLNGDFALALFDAGRGRLVLARDVMGARPLYYCQLPDTLVFASEIKAILAYPRVETRPDEDGLADLMVNGYYDGHRTCFDGICGVPPGHLVIATSEKVERRQHWDFDVKPIQYSSSADYAVQFQSLFRQAVQRRIRSAHPVAVSLSGGLDSSSIFCEAATLMAGAAAPVSLHPVSMTFPAGPPATDQCFLDEIHQSYGVSIDTLRVSSVRLLADAEKVIWHLEMPHLLWDAQGALLERTRRAGCRVILDGFFGDQMLSGQSYLVDLAYQGRWLTLRRDLREVAAWTSDASPRFFRQQFRADLLRSLAPTWLLRSARKTIGRWRVVERCPRWYTKTFRQRAVERALARPYPRQRQKSTHGEQCYRHATSGHYLALLQHKTNAGLMHNLDSSWPFRDRDLVAFLMAIPGDIVNWRGIPKGLLRRAMQGVLPDAIRMRRGKADFTALGNRAVLTDQAAILRLLTPDCLAAQAGFVDGKILQNWLKNLPSRLSDDSAVLGWQVSDVAALEIWLRVFLDGGLRGPRP